MAFRYKYEEHHIDLMKEQIWEARGNLDVYSDLSEFEFNQIKGWIGRPKTVMEVGCGLGRGSIYLNHLLQNDAHYILADRTGRTNNSGLYNPEVDEVYNDLEQTKEFCALNGLTNCETFDTEKDDWTTLPKCDIIFSLCSFGMHVSINRYMTRLLSVANKECTMIFGTRHGTYAPHMFQDKFHDTTMVTGKESTGGFPHEHWLILKNPK